ncbi:hypothetical protein [Szabonella alba]|uniref:Uncharacterized protein n=1 Tax=Szabonella alba TaxID=2804194 RepID=A0A8K0VD37_9RHOB|nr:hypothetical protein [Szabonella alba]MBL4916930.1 hypothetical protein [Szabonella alba]
MMDKARSSREYVVARRLHLLNEEAKAAKAPSMAEKARQGRIVALARRNKGADILRFELTPAMMVMPNTQVIPKMRPMPPVNPASVQQTLAY